MASDPPKVLIRARRAMGRPLGLRAGVRIGIAGLNSAWSCADNQDKAKLWCGVDWQIPQLKRRLGPVAFSFALIHHPGNWFTDREDPSAMRRLRQEFPILLHGHEHREWVEVDSDGHLVLSAGASNRNLARGDLLDSRF